MQAALPGGHRAGRHEQHQQGGAEQHAMPDVLGHVGLRRARGGWRGGVHGAGTGRCSAPQPRAGGGRRVQTDQLRSACASGAIGVSLRCTVSWLGGVMVADGVVMLPAGGGVMGAACVLPWSGAAGVAGLVWAYTRPAPTTARAATDVVMSWLAFMVRFLQ
eukprot:Opistho-1_new@24604